MKKNPYLWKLDEEEIIEEWEDDNDWEIIDKTTKE